jgi:hypothetical protein
MTRGARTIDGRVRRAGAGSATRETPAAAAAGREAA